MPDAKPVRITFDEGTIVLHSEPPASLASISDLQFDKRIGAWRAPAARYEPVIRALVGAGEAYVDEARSYEELSLRPLVDRTPRDYQREALEAWRRSRRRGVVVLPTGSGKSLVAIMAILERPRSTLIVAPTIDLMNQWHDLLTTWFDVPVGTIGGGSYELHDLTCTTYDSAYIHLGRLGGRFGLVVFDECHHLPGPSFSVGAELTIAPFRLGLTATPERPDGRHAMLGRLIGPICYRREITEMAGGVLSDYELATIHVELGEAERKAYDEARQVFRGYIDKYNIRLGGSGGWARFLMEATGSEEGRLAFQAWRTQRRISLATPRKLRVLEELLHEHQGERILVFTADNATVYEISRRFLVPAITHRTKSKERRTTLQRFNDGTWPVLVTSRVLNEGVNIPEASVGIVLSGSGTVREHVQRLGRILRKVEGKSAKLYEVIARGTTEESISERRRQHDAYR